MTINPIALCREYFTTTPWQDVRSNVCTLITSIATATILTGAAGAIVAGLGTFAGIGIMSISDLLCDHFLKDRLTEDNFFLVKTALRIACMLAMGIAYVAIFGIGSIPAALFYGAVYLGIKILVSLIDLATESAAVKIIEVATKPT